MVDVRSGVLACLAMLLGGCVSEGTLENRPCDCAQGWACCPARAVCVRPDQLAGCFADDGAAVDGGGADAGTPDTAAPDAAPDAPARVSFLLPADGATVQGALRLKVVAPGLALARLELWVDGTLRAMGDGPAGFVDWSAFDETLGTYPAAAHRLKLVALAADGGRFEEERRVFVTASPWGDCDSDGTLTDGDATAVGLERNDGDPDDAESAAGGTHLGSPACDANDDNVIDERDEACLRRPDRGFAACVPAELPAVRTVVFLPTESHALADDPALRALVRDKLEEARRFFARHNGGKTFRPLEVEVFRAPRGRGAYWKGAALSDEDVMYDLGLPGYIEPSNKVLTPWNRALWVFVVGGSDRVSIGRFANGHAYALVGDAYLTAARDLTCTDVNAVTPGDPVKQTCQGWAGSGRIYGQAMGRAVQALAVALGARPVARDSTAWPATLLGDHSRYPDTDLTDTDRAAFAISHYFPGSHDTKEAEITVLDPAPGAIVSQPIIIRAVARDDVGVKRLRILIDDTVTNADPVSPVDGDFGAVGAEYLWDPATVAPGLHTIRVLADDTADNIAITNLQVTVTR